jgi:hypothetical protein
MASLHHEFEWDAAKAVKNREKHHVTFEDAATVLADAEGESHQLTEYDDAHSTAEDRFVTIGSFPADRQIILTICWTERSTAGGRATRIISARPASRRERARRAEETGET